MQKQGAAGPATIKLIALRIRHHILNWDIPQWDQRWRMLLEREGRALIRKELRQARLQAEMRQVDVSVKLGKPQSYVAKVESGERRVDLVEALRFCAAIGLDPHALVDKLL